MRAWCRKSLAEDVDVRTQAGHVAPGVGETRPPCSMSGGEWV